MHPPLLHARKGNHPALSRPELNPTWLGAGHLLAGLLADSRACSWVASSGLARSQRAPCWLGSATLSVPAAASYLGGWAQRGRGALA